MLRSLHYSNICIVLDLFLSQYSDIEIDNNYVEITPKNGIVHTKFDYFPGAYIIPKEVGEFEAKVTLMCAEYEDPEKTTIRFIVEE